MAQGLDVRCLSSAKSPPPAADSVKTGENAKKTRGLGSRRIFSPQFKLQVLDSYRNDLDCRGNQRATARKYNIHRRQIQKWLQCEQSLRTSVEESGKNEAVSKSSKKKSEEDETDLTLNRSAATAESARLVDAVKRNEAAFKPILRLEGEESKTEARNLKRVAQKLYPSLPCVAAEKVARAPPPGAPRIGPNYFRRDISLRAFDLSTPGSGNKRRRDDNFNEIVRTEKEREKVGEEEEEEEKEAEEGEEGEENEEPLDLKSKVRSKISPEEILESNVVDEIPPEGNRYKLRIGDGEICRSGLTSSSENVGGPKLSVSKAVFKCLVQKSNMGDIDGRELSWPEDSKRNELLGSRIVNGGVESSRLWEMSNSSFRRLPDATVKRKVKSEYEAGEGKWSGEEESCFYGEPESKKWKVENEDGNSIKSFNPKRKWIRESMQEMSEVDGGRHTSLEPSSLPIKQRVKMNLRSRAPAEDSIKPNLGTSSNFTIEKLCSTDFPRRTDADSDFCDRNPSDGFGASEIFFASPPRPPPLVFSDCIVPDFVSLRVKTDLYDSPPLEKSTSDHDPNDYPLNVPVKEEKIFEEEEEEEAEDVDVDILSTTPTEKKSFDFSGYNFGKRRSFSVQFKLTVLDAFYHDKDCNKNQRATARKFNINRRQVQKWLSQESDLRSENSLKSGKYLQRQREGDGCKKCPRHCHRKKEEAFDLERTIEVNVKPCSDRDCLSVRERFRDSVREKIRKDAGGVFDLYPRKTLPFPVDFYRNYFYPDNSNLIYHHRDSILGWSHLNSSALAVPDFQCLSSTWHQNFDLYHKNPKIY